MQNSPPKLHPKFQTYGMGKLLINTSFGSLYPPIDTTSVSLCLYYMGAEYNVDMDMTQWVLLTYLIMSSVCGACIGKFAERLGVDLAFKFAYLGLTVCNILIAVVPNIYATMVIRAFGGFFNSCGVATHAYLQRFLGKPSIITKLMSIQTMTLSLFNIAYPIIVGLINDVSTKSWRYVFILNAALTLECTISGFILIPRLPRVKGIKFDFLGIFLFLVGIACLNIGISSITFGWPWYIILVLFVLAVVSFILFVVCEKKVKNPMIPLDFIKDKDVAIFFLIVLLVIGVFSSKTMIIPYVCATSFKLNSLVSSAVLAVLMTFMGITSLALSKIFGKFVSKLIFSSSILLLSMGSVIEGVSYLFISIPVLCVGMAIEGIGIGIFFVCLMTGVFRFGAKNITLFAGLNNSFQNIGKSIVTSITSMFLTVMVNYVCSNNNYDPTNDPDQSIYADYYGDGAAYLTFIISGLGFLISILSFFMRITDNERGKIGFKEKKLERNTTNQTIMMEVANNQQPGGNGLIESMVEVSDEFSDDYLSDF